MDRTHQRSAGRTMIAEYCKICRYERMRNCLHPDAPAPGITLRGVPIVDLTTRPAWCPLAQTHKRHGELADRDPITAEVDRKR